MWAGRKMRQFFGWQEGDQEHSRRILMNKPLGCVSSYSINLFHNTGSMRRLALFFSIIEIALLFFCCVCLSLWFAVLFFVIALKWFSRREKHYRRRQQNYAIFYFAALLRFVFEKNFVDARQICRIADGVKH